MGFACDVVAWGCPMKIYTIQGNGGQICAVDADGQTAFTRKTYCNPAAMHQLVLDVEMAGGVIDWENSDETKPEWAQ